MGKNNAALSKNLLQMKFMQKVKEKVEKEEEEEKSKELINTDLHKALQTEGNKFIVEPSYSVCEDLIFGRMSFKGMNPEVERMGTEKRAREETAENEEDVDVSRRDMTERMESNIDETPVGPPAKRRKRTRYIRPVDE